MPKERVAVYFDGFNMYHALHDLNEPFLKWLNLQDLSKLLIQRRSQVLAKVAYFSAVAHYFQNTENEGRIRRHESYIRALEAKGVECHLGNFAKRDHYYRGKGYRAKWLRREEKQTDVAIAVHVTSDAFNDLFDKALIVSLDTDMLPVFRVLKPQFPNKKFITVAPPARAHHRDLLTLADDHMVIKRSQLTKSLFGARVVKDGSVVAYRPKAYAP
ncbi:NYN domain-containing protein [Roseibium sp.]|uniref:NYN domain-containing protein n=1 Tax=Roseibium sp. TaxID=1936156 RepID=UPI003B50612F